MKNYRDSDYAVNKYAGGIVYLFADKIVELTLEDYLRENPGMTEVDFAELKALSDEIYLEQVRSDSKYGKKAVSLNDLEDTELCVVPSLEETIIDRPDRLAAAKRRQELADRSLAALTEVQYRRYRQHVVESLSTWEIAELEGTNQKSVYESLQAAEKKIKKICKR